MIIKSINRDSFGVWAVEFRKPKPIKVIKPKPRKVETVKRIDLYT